MRNRNIKSITILRLALCLMLVLLASCSNSQEIVKVEKQLSKDQKVLIVYLSRTNNTKTVAELIQKHVGGDLVALELQNPYPKNYQEAVAQVADENAQGYLPELKTKIDAIAKYDVIFIGFPTWGMQLPPPIKSFVRQYQLKGKTIIPFNTNAGYDVGSGFDKLKELCPDSKVTNGFTVKGGIERDGILFVMEGAKKKTTEEELYKWLLQLETFNLK